MKASNEIYVKSNSFESTDFKKLDKKFFTELLSDKDREVSSQKLCDYLCDTLKIPHCKVNVTNTAQPHATNYRGTLKQKTLGVYTTNARVITMYNKTAVKKQTVAIKTFADTLLHEFIHHYDMEYLKLGASIHTAGFYKRISDLKNKLI